MRRAPSLRLGARAALSLWSCFVVAGLICLGGAAVGGPHVASGVGAVLIVTAATWWLTVRCGGRPLLFSTVAAAVGVLVVAVGNQQLCTGASVMTAAIVAVLAVMGTVPSVRFRGAAAEVLLAAVICVIGAAAALGFDPAIEVGRYQDTTLAFAVVGGFVLVYRLGAGFHGLGRRGVVVVAAGGVLLVVTLLYAELLRTYGSSSIATAANEATSWCRHHLGSYPRPVEALLGVPALTWGTHMRARRRQGWWVCAFGVAFTAPAITTFGNPGLSVVVALLSVAYSVVVGLVIGYVVIRVDLRLTSPRSRGGSRAAGRRAAREAEVASAVRPEPSRVQPLL